MANSRFAIMRGGQGSKRFAQEDQVFYDFILAFFRYQGILYTKIGKDELEDLQGYLFKLLFEYFKQIDKETNKSDEINKIIHLEFCMIFNAHATIADAIKDS